MVGLECLGKITPICISKKLGLYIKNADDKYLRDQIKDELIDDYNKNLERNADFRKEIIQCFCDKYYSGLLNANYFKYNSRQIISLISKYLIIFDYEFSNDSIITDDEIFDRCDEDKLSTELKKTPLINPLDEYEIEYKFLYLYNFVERSKTNKRDDLDMIFYTGFPNWQFNEIFNRFIIKTFKERKEVYILYKYYDNYENEYNDKIGGLISFGKKFDIVIKQSSDYMKLDFIVETLLAAENNQYSILNYISLIEMLIVNPKCDTRNQMKQKLKFFINNDILKANEESEIEYYSGLIYDIRSRLIHGNFNSLKKELIKYKNRYMQSFNFDYGEYKEENWILISISIKLRQIVKNIMIKFFNEYEKLEDFKFDRINSI